jgi:hypothetical protein
VLAGVCRHRLDLRKAALRARDPRFRYKLDHAPKRIRLGDAPATFIRADAERFAEEVRSANPVPSPVYVDASGT